jgi:hypothetical protein
MRCSSCANDNPADARFCEHCGSPASARETDVETSAERVEATPTCPACGVETRSGLRFCEQCATPLPDEPSPPMMEPGPAAYDVPTVSAPPPPSSTQGGEASVPLAPTVREAVAPAGRVCRTCGYLNPTSARHCADCGEVLVLERAPVAPQPSAISRVLGIAVRIGASAVIAVVTAVATRYLLSYMMGLGLIP